MSGLFREAMLLVCASPDLLADAKIWGHGGWMQPEEREALDWLTLARIAGWNVTIARQTGARLSGDLYGGNRWIVIACNPWILNEDTVYRLSSRLRNEPLLLVTRAGNGCARFDQLSGIFQKGEENRGEEIRWIGPGPSRIWHCKHRLPFTKLELTPDASVWATADGTPLIVARECGASIIATLGFHPSEARDADGTATALLRHLLICGSLAPVAWLDWAGTLVLRMDDPGGAQNVFNRHWRYPKLSECDWRAIGADLSSRSGRLSIAYTAGWVDDGDTGKGTLTLNRRPAERVPGKIHPSPMVQYWDLTGHAAGTFYDYISEFAGIQVLRQAGLADVELHGYTHMHPDTAKWATAPDRYEDTRWFRELGKAAAAFLAQRSLDQHPLKLAVTAFETFFQTRPTTLISPGDEWTDETLERALQLGIQLVDSYYLAVRHDNRFCWCLHVCSPYLNDPSDRWFDSGLPVVGYFHDMEPALEGVGWIHAWLSRWQEVGARRLIDFRELAAGIGRNLYLQETDGALQLHLNLADEAAPDLVRALHIGIHCPEISLPSKILVSIDGEQQIVEVTNVAGFGAVAVPRSVNANVPAQKYTHSGRLSE